MAGEDDYSWWSNSTPDLSNTGWDSSFGSGATGSFNPADYSFSVAPQSYQSPLDFGAGSYSDLGGGASMPGTAPVPQAFGPASPSPMSAPGAATPAAAGGSPWLGPQGLATMLGLGGSLAGIIGQVAGGGKGATQTAQQTKTLTPQAQNQVTQSYQALTPIAQGISPLQQQQNSLLAALANGQGLPPGYAQLIEQAFQPQFGDVYQQAVNAGRARGFYDAPGTSPAGSNVLGPALSNLQGQMAAAKLSLMQNLPGLYNTPIANQSNAAQGLSASLLNGAQFGQGFNQTQNTQGNQAANIGGLVGGAIQGIGQGISQAERDRQNQANFDRQMQIQQNAINGGINMSGAPVYR